MWVYLIIDNVPYIDQKDVNFDYDEHLQDTLK
jgi:hypothetical protein